MDIPNHPNHPVGKAASLETEIKRLKTQTLSQANGGDKGAARVTMAKYKALEQQLASRQAQQVGPCSPQ